MLIFSMKILLTLLLKLLLWNYKIIKIDDLKIEVNSMILKFKNKLKSIYSVVGCGVCLVGPW